MYKILIAVDGGPTSERVASQGFELGRQLNAEMALLSVVDTALLATDGGVTPKEMATLIKNDFITGHQLLIDHVFKNSKVWTFVEEGKPFEAILKAAGEWGANLIVLGTHGKGGLAHLFMGSVTDKIIRHSMLPLLIVPLR